MSARDDVPEVPGHRRAHRPLQRPRPDAPPRPRRAAALVRGRARGRRAGRVRLRPHHPGALAGEAAARGRPRRRAGAAEGHRAPVRGRARGDAHRAVVVQLRLRRVRRRRLRGHRRVHQRPRRREGLGAAARRRPQRAGAPAGRGGRAGPRGRRRRPAGARDLPVPGGRPRPVRRPGHQPARQQRRARGLVPRRARRAAPRRARLPHRRAARQPRAELAAHRLPRRGALPGDPPAAGGRGGARRDVGPLRLRPVRRPPLHRPGRGDRRRCPPTRTPSWASASAAFTLRGASERSRPPPPSRRGRASVVSGATPAQRPSSTVVAKPARRRVQRGRAHAVVRGDPGDVDGGRPRARRATPRSAVPPGSAPSNPE